jgi:hypothetical protein
MSTITTLDGLVIKTAHEPPPIPTRKFDWSAIDDNTYDGEGCPCGYGATEGDAVLDLLTQLEEREP